MIAQRGAVLSQLHSPPLSFQKEQTSGRGQVSLCHPGLPQGAGPGVTVLTGRWALQQGMAGDNPCLLSDAQRWAGWSCPQDQGHRAGAMAPGAASHLGDAPRGPGSPGPVPGTHQAASHRVPPHRLRVRPPPRECSLCKPSSGACQTHLPFPALRRRSAGLAGFRVSCDSLRRTRWLILASRRAGGSPKGSGDPSRTKLPVLLLLPSPAAPPDFSISLLNSGFFIFKKDSSNYL